MPKSAFDCESSGAKKIGRFASRFLRRRWFPLTVLILLLPFLSGSAFAQFDTAVVVGTVTDVSGAAVPGADVTLRNTALGVSQVKKTSSSGDYEFPGIQIGSYVVTVTAPGFSPVTTAPFDVTISARQRANIILKPGTVSQDVIVSSGETGLETDTSDRSQIFERQQITDLPLNGREYTDLALLTPGVQVSSLQDGTVNQRRGSLVVNGMRSSANNFLLDGLDNNDYQIANQGFNNEAVDESVDAVGEFRVETGNFAAEYGRAGGAIINVSTRSGSKNYHASAWEYARNTAFDAFGPFYGTGQKPVLIQNQYGGTFGGEIPHTATFYFADYEGFRQILRQYQLSSIPTLQQRQGIFTDPTINPSAPPVAIPLINPFTGTTHSNGIIPASEITPFAAAVIAVLPQPTDNTAVANNFTYLPPGTNYRDIGDVRLDHYFGSKVQSFVRLSKQSGHIYIASPSPGDAGGDSGGHVRILTSQIATGVTYTVTPHDLIDGRLGITWTNSGKNPDNFGEPSFQSRFGIPYPVAPFLGSAGLNSQSIHTFEQLGTQSSDNQYTNPYTVNPKISVTLDRHKHSISFGYEYFALMLAIATNNPVYGVDTYAGNFSKGKNQPASGTPEKEAWAFADFLYGARSSYELSNRINFKENMRFHYAYVEDSWKALPNLTVNYGLRYEFTVPMWEAQNRISNFDPQMVSLVQATNGSIASRSLVNPQLDNFAPRFGFSWQPRSNVVLRGGYGISYSQYNRYGAEGALDQNGPDSVDTLINQTPVGTPLCADNSTDLTCFRNTMQGYPANMIAPSAFSTEESEVRYLPKNSRTPYTQSFTLGTQNQLGPKTVLDIAYVGARSKHLRVLGDYNQASVQPTLTSTLSLQQRRPISTFTDISDNMQTGFLNYDSLQVKLQHHSQHLFILNSFTWSKARDLAEADTENSGGDSAYVNFDNIHGDAGISGYNQPFNDSLALTWDLPYGRDAQTLHGIVKRAAGGWQLTAIERMTSGWPINLNYSPSTVAMTTDLGYSFRPNITGPLSTVLTPRHTWVKTSSAYENVFNSAQLSEPSQTQVYGNSPRNGLLGPAYYNLDLGVHKSFALPERLRLEFRGESFNIFNRTNFKAPVDGLDSASFATFGPNDVYPSREMQLAVRIIY
jgi:hypothetical protein